MGKKLTDASKWKSQRWFRKLPFTYKLVYDYVHDLCDIDGTWIINCPDLIDDLGLPEPFNLDDFIACCNTDYDNLSGQPIERHRILKIGTEIIWLTGYIKEQLEGSEFETVNPSGHFAIKALNKLGGKGVLGLGLIRGFIPLTIPLPPLPEGLYPPYLRGQYNINTNKDKDKEILRYIDQKVVEMKAEMKKTVKPKNETIPAAPTNEGEGGRPGAGDPAGDQPDMDLAVFQKYEQELIDDQLFIEPLMMTKGIKSEDTLKLWLTQFRIHIAGNSDISKDYKAFKRHFKNWINKQPTFDGPPEVASLNGNHRKVRGGTLVPAATDADLDKYRKQKA